MKPSKVLNNLKYLFVIKGISLKDMPFNLNILNLSLIDKDLKSISSVVSGHGIAADFTLKQHDIFCFDIIWK